MDDLTRYFVRHYTLVLDNDQGSYNMCREFARDVLTSEEVTLSEYLGMSVHGRADRFAMDIGNRILEWIDEVIDETLTGGGGLAEMLIREVMNTSDSDIAFHLGAHYLPDADEFLSDDEDDEGDEVPDDYPVKVLGPDDPATDRVTCGECGRSWDDAVVTGMTPVPSGRCPFEAYHL
jgi:hypothetical protein